MTSMATLVAELDSDNQQTGVFTVDLTDAIAAYPNAEICIEDAPLYVMGIDDDGSIDGNLYQSATTKVKANTDGMKSVIEMTTVTSTDSTVSIGNVTNVMVDYYIDLLGTQVFEADITANTFAGYFYVEADTLFRQQSTGKDLPANLTFPNVKVQSNFTITMAGTGDPSTFSFTMDAFPGYTYFDKTKKVLCVLQIMDAVNESNKKEKSVMPHTDEFEHDDPNDILVVSETKATAAKLGHADSPKDIPNV